MERGVSVATFNNMKRARNKEDIESASSRATPEERDRIDKAERLYADEVEAAYDEFRRTSQQPSGEDE
jgi:hypothetical protein